MDINHHGLFGIGFLCCPLDHVLSPYLTHVSFLRQIRWILKTSFSGQGKKFISQEYFCPPSLAFWFFILGYLPFLLQPFGRNIIDSSTWEKRRSVLIESPQDSKQFLL